ncbi:MAG: ATP-binding protein [Chitinophagales bacterium]|nr:ATP-binding protein [Chitinophagales bacterium]
MQAVILIGVSGSGKSTYARNNYPEFIKCSADDYFMIDGKYNFNFAKLGEAHGECLKKFILACQNKQNVIVDNTNTSIEEIAPYFQVARAYGYDVTFVMINCDIDKCAERNLHGVGLNSVKTMRARINNLKLPKYWKFELKEVDSN